MFDKIRFLACVIIGAVLVTGAIYARAGYAQPGTDADPVISLSYLETALAITPIVLEGGEDFQVASGRGLALIAGGCRLTPPAEGRSWVLDVSSGEVLTGAVEMAVGHLYIPVADDSESAIFNLQAWQSSTLAIPGGAGR